MKTISPWALGATLYMPATRPDLLDVVFGKKLAGLRSMVICLEDAVAFSDVEVGLLNLARLLKSIESLGGRDDSHPLLFVRPRDANMASILSQWPLIGLIDGFVVPKISMENIQSWRSACSNSELFLMPTLETPEVFNPSAMSDLGHALRDAFHSRIIALRIGGNDLMGCLGLRRSNSVSFYQTPMGYVIPMLAGVLGSQGFYLTAPVFERIDSHDMLTEELRLDVANGLVGKTAIHPVQINVIHNELKVDATDLQSAEKILESSSPAVFKMNGAMCEPATHAKWAQSILERAKWHGVKGSDKFLIDLKNCA